MGTEVPKESPHPGKRRPGGGLQLPLPLTSFHMHPEALPPPHLHRSRDLPPRLEGSSRCHRTLGTDLGKISRHPAGQGLRDMGPVPSQELQPPAVHMAT